MNVGAFCFPLLDQSTCRWRKRMKLISCVIRPDRLPAVKEALFRAGVTGITITRASGHGGGRDTGGGGEGIQLPPPFPRKGKGGMGRAGPLVAGTITTP